ncbi:MAG: bifunctional 3-deoxy-7-phosphoheptulonate synthase/chorismate mutase type II [Bacteroidetes bacterium]|nr:bifunctional 3-deoxy-7-phosphoheptulonate synthase/chorismate mutase type II [Bacteroidota bacterium]
MEFSPTAAWCTCPGPLIIAGPCSAETEYQVLKTAEELSRSGKVGVFRAGLWKPRTHPGLFEGVGAAGLPWMKKVKESTGLLTTVEAGHPDHIRLALDQGIDMIWIGARTVVNPFMMNEIAGILENRDIPVLIKNPVYPDTELWTGALERIYHAGIRKIVAIHRGFYSYDKSRFRNDPLWELPIELRRRMPSLPMICDPSHIAGSRNYIREVAQAAFDLGMDGLMVEVHYDPDQALTDRQQQITPATLDEILSGLRYGEQSAAATPPDRLEDLRRQIDRIDASLLDLLAKRFGIAEEIAMIKQSQKLNILQLKRWEHVLESRLRQGKLLGLEESFLKKILEQIHKESIRRQSEYLND